MQRLIGFRLFFTSLHPGPPGRALQLRLTDAKHFRSHGLRLEVHTLCNPLAGACGRSRMRRRLACIAASSTGRWPPKKDLGKGGGTRDEPANQLARLLRISPSTEATLFIPKSKC